MKNQLEEKSKQYEITNNNKTSFLSGYVKEIMKIQVRKKNIIYFLKNIITFILLISFTIVFDLFQQFVIGFNQTNFVVPFISGFFVLSLLLLTVSKGLFKCYVNIHNEKFIGNLIALTIITLYSFYSLLILDCYTLFASVLVGLCLILIDFAFSNINNFVEDSKNIRKGNFKIINYFTISFFYCSLLFINSELVIRDIATGSSVYTFIIFELYIIIYLLFLRRFIKIYSTEKQKTSVKR